MVTLIPGRIRHEGIALYEAEVMKLDLLQDGLILADFGENHLSYHLKTSHSHCDCELFAQKGYCKHLACVEYYLKQDNDGKRLLDQWTPEPLEKALETSLGGLFLDGLAMNEDDRLKYSLSASGQVSPYSSEFWWTLKIKRQPDERFYVIKDIRAFLKVLREEKNYQIGKNYYESISLIQFDQASQEFLTFLWRLVPDGDRLDLSFLFPNHGRHLQLSSGFFEEGVELMMGLELFSFEHHLTYKEVLFKNLDESSGLFDFRVTLHRHHIELVIHEKPFVPIFNSQYLLYQNCFYRLTPKQIKMVKQLRTLPLEQDLSKHLYFNLEDQPKLASSLLDFKTLGSVSAPKHFEIRDFTILFEFDLIKEQMVSLQVTFDYGNHRVSRREEMNALPFTSNVKREESLIRLLKDEGFGLGFEVKRPALQKEELYQFFHHSLKRFAKLGQVRLSEKLQELQQVSQPLVRIDRQGGLLEVTFDFSDLAQEDVAKAKQSLLNQEAYFVGKQGQLIVFDDDIKKISQILQYLRGKATSDGRLHLSGVLNPHLMATFSDYSSVHFSETCQQMAYDLAHPEDFSIGPVQQQFPLRDYQLTGVKWLSMLDYYGFGGILADDMGLGKTLQTIAFLNEKMTSETRVLILSPSSLIYNWQDELKRFAPKIAVMVAYGTKSTREEIIAKNPQVLITSYSAFRQDFDLYQQRSFDYLILDEAQVIKNSQTQIAQRLRDFEVKRCFALSGTPIENRLLEIWSIFQMVLPGVLPNKTTFSKLNLEEVSRYITPFIMRRRKEDVLPELPSVTETVYYNELEEEQKALYLAQLDQITSGLQGATAQELNHRRIDILSGITRLRQICDTPSLFMPYQADSGKLASLRQLLSQLRESGRRALVFSQFKGMLELAGKELLHLGLTYYQLTGSTSAFDRQEMTRAFNKGSKDMFLISLKAGGVGLNLTGADAVILIDLWWNPAVEEQAISRAHRLGQKRHVDVYRLITKGTIEEKILALQESKKELMTSVLDGGDSRNRLSLDDIKEILGLT